MSIGALSAYPTTTPVSGHHDDQAYSEILRIHHDSTGSKSRLTCAVYFLSLRSERCRCSALAGVIESPRLATGGALSCSGQAGQETIELERRNEADAEDVQRQPTRGGRDAGFKKIGRLEAAAVRRRSRAELQAVKEYGGTMRYICIFMDVFMDVHFRIISIDSTMLFLTIPFILPHPRRLNAEPGCYAACARASRG